MLQFAVTFVCIYQLFVGNATMLQAPILDGNFQVNQITEYQSTLITLDVCSNGESLLNDGLTADEILHLCGSLLDDSSNERGTFTLDFFPSPLSANQISFSLNVTRSLDDNNSGPNDRLYFIYSCEEDESFHGFGESFTDFDLRNRVVPVLVSEQGVGRGLQPITDYLNSEVEGTGGYWYTTYAPKPLYLTNYNKSIVYLNSEVMYFNLTALDRVEVELWGFSLSGIILSGSSMESLVGEITLVTGRMQTPPSWTQQGAVVRGRTYAIPISIFILIHSILSN